MTTQTTQQTDHNQLMLEREFIALALYDPEEWHAIAPGLRPTIVDAGLHREIIAAMQALAIDGHPVHQGTVVQHIDAERRETVELYLRELMTTIVPIGSLLVAHQKLERRRQNRMAETQAARLVEAQREGRDDEARDWLRMLTETVGRTAGARLHPWRLRTLTEALEPLPPREYVVDQFFARGSLNIVYSAPGSLKSMQLLDMAFCVLTGLDWLPGKGGGIQTERSNVLWIDNDNGGDTTQRRIAAAHAARPLPDDKHTIHWLSMPDPAFMLDTADATDYLIAAINEAQAGLVILDNLKNAATVEENSGEMATVMSRLRTAAERTNAAIIIVHHQRKGSGSGRAGDAIRGHSSIEAAVDMALHFVREDGTGDVSIRSTKTRHVHPPEIIARLTFSHISGTNELESFHFSAVERLSIPDAFEILTRDILHVLEDAAEPMSKAAIVEAVQKVNQTGRDAIRKHLDLMAMRHDIEEDDQGPGRAKLYEARR